MIKSFNAKLATDCEKSFEEVITVIYRYSDQWDGTPWSASVADEGCACSSITVEPSELDVPVRRNQPPGFTHCTDSGCLTEIDLSKQQNKMLSFPQNESDFTCFLTFLCFFSLLLSVKCVQQQNEKRPSVPFVVTFILSLFARFENRCYKKASPYQSKKATQHNASSSPREGHPITILTYS